MIALFFIGIYPTVFAVVTSFRRYNITRRADMLDGFPFVGFDNYRQAFSDQTFWDSLALTGKFFLSAAPLQIVLGVMIALMLHRPGWACSAGGHARLAGRAARDHLRGRRPDRAADLQSRLRRRQPVPGLARRRLVRLARQSDRGLHRHRRHGRVAVDAVRRADLPRRPLDGCVEIEEAARLSTKSHWVSSRYSSSFPICCGSPPSSSCARPTS